MRIPFLTGLLIFTFSWSFSQTIEKNYLTTDKDIYAPKDTVWFKGYVFDVGNVLSNESISHHVFLVSSDGTKLLDTSWPIYDGLSQGYLIAPEFEGNYKVVAISGQMVGSKVDQAFTKELFVRSELADEIEILAFPQFQEFLPNQDNSVDIFTMFSENTVAPDVKLTYQILSGGKQLKRGRLKTSEEGKVTLDLKAVKTEYSDLTLLVESEDKRLTKPVKLALPIPTPQQNIDLQFFPEGGEMINGIVSKIAFKAIDENGKPFDFKGLLMNSKGEIVGSAESYYQGMGAFRLIPEKGEEYFFQVSSPYKVDSLYKLPKAKNTGISLSLSDKQKDGKQYIIARASPDLIKQKGQLTISKNDKTISEVAFNFSKQENWEVAYENLGVGIYSFLVTNENGSPLAERLLFANPQEQLQVNIQTDKVEYNSREEVKSTIKITDVQGNPVQGNFSMAVIDKSRSKSPVAEQPNLLGQILLQSELKGNIPTPNFYFSKDTKAKKALDFVMLTNGWRKYTPSEKGDPEQLYGRLIYKNLEKRPLKDRDIFFTPNKGGIIETFKTNENGEFRIASTYLKNQGDSFLVFSNVKNKKDQPGISFNDDNRIEKIRFTDKLVERHQVNIQNLNLFNRENKLKPDRFQNTILLNSVTVESNRNMNSYIGNCPLEERHFQSPWTTKMIKDLDTKNEEILGLIKQVNPSIRKYTSSYDWNDWFVPEKPPQWEQALYLDVIIGELQNGRTLPYQIYLNCKPVPMVDFFYDIDSRFMSYGDFSAKSVLEYIDIDYVESISINRTYFEPPESLLTMYNLNVYFEQVDWPIIQINTVNDIVVYRPPFISNIVHIAYKNYTKEFYAPVYETEKQRKDPVPDLRTTIFWQANVFTDKNGQATISFYNADRPNQMEITVEGVDAFSRLGFGSAIYQVLEGPETEEGDKQ